MTATAPSEPTPASPPNAADWWWVVVAVNLVAFVAVFVLNETRLTVLPSLGWIRFVGAVVVLTAPAVVAIAVHFDRKYVAAVSDWKPRSEYVLLGLLMWFGVGVPLALLYLSRRRDRVGVP